METPQTPKCYCDPRYRPSDGGHTGECVARNQYEVFRASRQAHQMEVPPEWDGLKEAERVAWTRAALLQLLGL